MFPHIHAGSMISFEGKEAVAQWEEAAATLLGLADAAYQGQIFENPALAQSFLEAAIRAEAMLKRARERVGEASVE